MSLFNRVTNALLNGSAQSPYARMSGMQMASSIQAIPQVHLYRLLRSYYLSNGLYDALTQSLYDRTPRQTSEPLKPLRNPTYRTVEFYVSHVWPGTLPEALPIVSENVDIIPAIQQVWKWSNWAAQKQVAIRNLAITGDLFIKVVQTVNRRQVYFQIINAEHVVDFGTDHRGFLTRIRVDTPQIDTTDRNPREWTYTEVWDKETQTMRIWRHNRGDLPLEQLGDAAEVVPFGSFGIDFVPFVHVMFRDVGEDRGMAAVMPALDKIDEANRQATRLSQMVFRYGRPIWALGANALDKSGRPVPPTMLGAATNDTLTIDGDVMLSLPGMATLQPLIPDINYADSLKILQDMMRELQNDLPELAYYELRDLGTLSGRAVRLLLSAAIARVLEVRGNAEAGLIQADEMALSMMAGADLGVSGSFDAGDFEHTFAARDVIAIDELEEAQGAQAQAQAGQAWTTAGMPFSEVLRRSGGGYSEDDIARILDEKAAEVDPAGAEEVPEQDR